MRCPICSAIVTGGDVCQSCGATLPANVRGPKPPARRGGLLSGAAQKAKRPGTLGDLFRSATATRAPEPPPKRSQRPMQRDEKQPAREPQRARNVQPIREAQPARDGRRPARRPTFGRRAPAPPSPPSVPRSPIPPAPVTPPSNYPSSLDPWASTYDAAPFAAPPVSVPPSPPPSGYDDGLDLWQADPGPGWGTAAPPVAASAPFNANDTYDAYDAYDGYSGAPADEWQQPVGVPMQQGVPLQGAPWSGAPYGMAGPSLGMPRRRPTIAGVSRLTLNVTMFGLVLLILAVAILVGLRYVQSTQLQVTQSTQPTPTIAPTVVPPSGFSGLQANLFSVSYPSGWAHNPTGDALGCGCSLTGETFGDGATNALSIYTRPAAPSDELAQVVTQAAASVSPDQTPRAALLNQQRTYGGGHWIENDYTVIKIVKSAVVQFQMRVLVINFNATTYIVIASAPQSNFTQANNSYFEPMLRSFRFD